MPLLRRNLDLGPPLRLSSWRKQTFGMWRSEPDPTIYALLEIDVENALNYLSRLALETGHRLTLSHLAVKVIAETLARHPELNTVLRLGRLYPRQSIDVFVLVAMGGQGEDLTGIIIRHADKRSISDIAAEIQERSSRVRSGSVRDFAGNRKLIDVIPGLLVGPVLRITEFLLYTLNVWTPLVGMPPNPFGSAIMTNVGSVGVPMSFAPLAPRTRVPVMISLGTVEDRPVVRNGQLAIGRILRVCFTLDHRVVDGVLGGRLAGTFQELFTEPEVWLGTRAAPS